MPSKKEPELIIQLQTNDLKAFDKLYQNYSEKLYRFSISLLTNNEDSEEIVQEVFLKVWDKRKEMDSTITFKSKNYI